MKAEVKTEKSVTLRKRRKAARPGEIIEAGLLEFAENGYAATRLVDVARRAGVVKGTIYRYFDDKEALFLAAVRSRTTPAIDEFSGMIDAYDGSTDELLKQIIGAFHQMLLHSDMHVLLRIILSEGRNFPQLTALHHAEVITKGQKLLELVIARGIERGEVNPNAATRLPIIVMAPALMAAVWNMLFARYQAIEAEQFLNAHIDLVLEGVLVK